VFNIVAGVSLVLCVATVVSWAYSYINPLWRESIWKEKRGQDEAQIFFSIACCRGQIFVEWSTVIPPLSASYLMWHNHSDYAARRTAEIRVDAWGGIGFYLSRSSFQIDRSMHGSYFNVAAPYWGISTIIAVIPIAWIVHFLRRKRRGIIGCCRTCGYDLRATPDRCPECGTAVEASDRVIG
jgi:hypothetical protein